METTSIPLSESSVAFSKAADIGRELLAGACGGAAVRIVEYPFDTIKVRCQTQNAIGLSSSPIQVFKRTVNNEGMKALYKGLSLPLALSAVEIGVMMFGYYCGNQFFKKINNNDELSLRQMALSGGFAGFILSWYITPSELVKCRLQSENSTKLYRSPIDCIHKTFKSESLKTFYRGNIPTLIREVPGCMIFYGVYETMCKIFAKGKGKDSLSPLSMMLGGAIAGSTYWSCLFPADVVKSQMQTEIGSKHHKNTGAMTIIRNIWRTQGIKGFYPGLGITIFRAFPANGVLFLTYESCNRWLGKKYATQ